ncbi:MAG: hypothetical protein ACYC7D_14975 [Nitrososphaerales archaeon]
MADFPIPKSIFGMTPRKFFSRLAYAILWSLVLLAVFLYIPSILLPKLGGQYSNVLSFGNLFFYYAVLIGFLEGIQILFKGHHIGDGAGIFNGVAQIFYIYLLTGGGIIAMNLASQGIKVSIDFRTILYLMMLPSALMIVSSVINALSRSSTVRTKEVEEIILN